MWLPLRSSFPQFEHLVAIHRIVGIRRIKKFTVPRKRYGKNLEHATPALFRNRVLLCYCHQLTLIEGIVTSVENRKKSTSNCCKSFTVSYFLFYNHHQLADILRFLPSIDMSLIIMKSALSGSSRKVPPSWYFCLRHKKVFVLCTRTHYTLALEASLTSNFSKIVKNKKRNTNKTS